VAPQVGTYYDLDAGQNDMIAFDGGGNIRWTVPNETPQIATADGGFIGESGITYDANGNATGQIANLPTYSWLGSAYHVGSVEQVVFTAPLYASTFFAALQGGNPSTAAPGQPATGPYQIPETMYMRSFAT
jgi:hypothetical protein